MEVSGKKIGKKVCFLERKVVFNRGEVDFD